MLYVFQSFIFCLALRPAAGKAGTRHAIAILRFFQNHFVFHTDLIFAQGRANLPVQLTY